MGNIQEKQPEANMTEEDHMKHWMEIDGEKDTVFNSFVNKTYKSFHSNGSQYEVAETFVFLKEGNTYVTKGSKSGRNCYTRKGNKLEHKKHPNNVCSFMHPNGEILWSHGYTSWPIDACETEEVDKDVPSQVTFEYWLGKNAKSFKTGDNPNTIAESFLFMREGNTYLTLG